MILRWNDHKPIKNADKRNLDLCVDRFFSNTVPLVFGISLLDRLAQRRMELGRENRVKELEQRMTRWESVQVELAHKHIQTLLKELRDPNLSPQMMSETFRELKSMRQSNFFVSAFEGMLQQSREYSNLLQNPGSYGKILKEGEELNKDLFPLFWR